MAREPAASGAPRPDRHPGLRSEPLRLSGRSLARWIAERAPAGAVNVAELGAQLSERGAAHSTDLTLVLLQDEGLALMPTPLRGREETHQVLEALRRGRAASAAEFALDAGRSAALRLLAGQEPAAALQEMVATCALFLLQRRDPATLEAWRASPAAGRAAVVRFDPRSSGASPFRYAVFELDEERDARLLSLKHVRADVPCGECTLCCRIFKVPLAPWEDPADFPGQVEPDGQGGWRLRHGEDGACINLVSDHCTIYERRPAACRAFDCRSAALNPSPPAGVAQAIARKGQEMIETWGEAAYLESLAASVADNDGFRDELVGRAGRYLDCLVARRAAEAWFAAHPEASRYRIEDSRAARALGSASDSVIAVRMAGGVRLEVEG